ncbi:MAG: class I SAM-dependent methyltransferase [Leptolyngbyaceae cyanobacterium MO_188.B28]|nr:class I SAM-dependent methyltransferase [Leptolyngbyaceae cyanobacterium MO_188.B28]
MTSNSQLYQLIAQQISQRPQQQITFSEYMDWVLYQPQHGYYATRDTVIGPRGDFITSPHLGHDFGELLAEQLADMWVALGRPTPFALVEMGAGQGLVAADVLQYLQEQHPNCLQAVEYTIVEKSAALAAEQQQRLQPWLAQGIPVQWRSLDEIPPNSIVGCCFSNELVDAFPVHQVVLTEAGLQEIYVACPAGQAGESDAGKEESLRFREVVGELSTPKLAEYFECLGITLEIGAYPQGYRTEVNLAAFDWIKQVIQLLQRGYLLTIDYGYPARRYYSPARSQGTLQCYYRHAHHDDPYEHIGHQDLTAHVNFTALERWGEMWDLETLGFTQQGMFLMALGLGDRIAAISHMTVNDPVAMQKALRRRDALHRLIDPMGLGNFGVLIQNKGLTVEEKARPLKGLTVPT